MVRAKAAAQIAQMDNGDMFILAFTMNERAQETIAIEYETGRVAPLMLGSSNN